VILELHKGDYSSKDVHIDWNNAKPLTVLKENLEVVKG